MDLMASHGRGAPPPPYRLPAAGEYLAFRLGAEEYGMDLLRVQEIRSFEPPTRLAGAPAFVCGVLNLRGVIVPVLDLRVRLGCPATSSAATVTIVLNVDDRVVGVVVDSVSDVIGIRGDDVKPAPEVACAADARYITGVATLRTDGGMERMLLLLDVASLIASEETGASPTLAPLRPLGSPA